MRLTLWTLAALAVSAHAASAQASGWQDPLLDRLVGEWVLEGTIGGEQVTHDVTATWVLGYYLQLHEVARERDATGATAYEAIVYIGWDAPTQRYACLWLDSTGGEGLTNGVIGYAARSGDSIPFLFRFPDGSPFYNTFAYDRATDTWTWSMDGVADGERQPFARVTLSRR